MERVNGCLIVKRGKSWSLVHPLSGRVLMDRINSEVEAGLFAKMYIGPGSESARRMLAMG